VSWQRADKQDRSARFPLSLSLDLLLLIPSHPILSPLLRSIFLIDGTALIYRSHYAFAASGASLTSSTTGEDTSIAVGFVNVSENGKRGRERGGAPPTFKPCAFSCLLSTLFFQTLIRLLEVTPPPTHIAVAFDVPGKTFR